MPGREDPDDATSMTDDEIDAAIRAAGADPVAIRERGAAVAEILLARGDAEYEARARRRVESMKTRYADWPDAASRSRAELLVRVRLARSDPRFHDVVDALLAASDGHRPDTDSETEAETETGTETETETEPGIRREDDELREIVDRIEVLRRLDRERGRGRR
jgi:hypothetical protein